MHINTEASMQSLGRRHRTVYRLYKLSERDGYVECSHSTSAPLMACILRACERQANGTALYEVRPALPAHVTNPEADRT